MPLPNAVLPFSGGTATRIQLCEFQGCFFKYEMGQVNHLTVKKIREISSCSFLLLLVQYVAPKSNTPEGWEITGAWIRLFSE